jgi:putative ABC transport system permease protein
MMEALGRDLRFGARMLRKSPAFTAVAVLTLALGIGANTAIFSVVRAALLQPLPYDHPEQLVRMRSQMSWPDMQDVINQSRKFTMLAGYSKLDLDYTQQVPAERVKSSTVTQSMLPMLGVQPELGRWFSQEEAKPGGEHLIIISHGFWQTRLGGDPRVLGRRLSFSGAAYTVIGVMPAGFQLPEDDAQAWTLFPVENADVLPYRGAHTLRAYGRLAPGINLDQARSELDAIADRLAKAYPVENTGTRFLPIPLHDYEVRDFRTGLLLLFAAVGLVLLIGCVNVANLLLTRASGRQREVAVRVALGANLHQLVRQFLVESLLLGVLGGTAALFLAAWLDRALLRLGSDAISRLDQARLDPSVLVFNFGLALLTAFLFGLLPAFSIARGSLQPLKAGTNFSAGPQKRRTRAVLVTAEIAMAMVLLIGAGLLLRSFQQLLTVMPGFNPDHVLTATLWLPAKQYREIPKRTIFFQQVHDNLLAIPGVTAVGGTTDLPFGDNSVSHNLIVAGRPPVPEGTEPEIYYRGITPDYFQAMQIPLIKGHGFSSADTATSQEVAVINQAMASPMFPHADPLG